MGEKLNNDVSRDRVFVVHGRNVHALQAMHVFLRSIGLLPREWPQAISATGRSSPFIGQILDAAFSESAAIVVLLTGDDEGRLKESLVAPADPHYERELTPQPRQNVLFEAGLAFGKNPDRTILVQLETIRPFSDIAGRRILNFDGSVVARQDLAQRLREAGCAVDTSGNDWLTCDLALGIDSLPKEIAENGFQGGELPREAIKILITLGDDNIVKPTPEGIAAKLNMNTHRVSYLLGLLKARRLIAQPRLKDGSFTVRLVPAGRQLLIENGLI